MRYIIILIFLFVFLKTHAQYSNYFSDAALRIEYVIAGNHDSQKVFVHALRKSAQWGGPQKNLTDTFGYGHYRVSVYDSVSSKLIFQRGFSSLFREWQDTPEAYITERAWNEVAVIPYPLKTVKIEIERRDKKNLFQPLYSSYINPAKDRISKDISAIPVFDVQVKGKASEKVDIVFVPDGYTKEEMKKFREDVKRFSGYLMKSKPFSENADNFNIRAVELPSAESGTDIPADEIWKNTAVSSSFYTFEMERYLNVFDMWSLYEATSGVPQDVVFVIVNSAKYGGSGIYNYYAVSSSDNIYSEYVAVHEFGHCFGGLGDEYYDKSTTYTEYYPFDVEPWEPNLTTMVDFGRKWKTLIDKSTPVPTPSDEKYLKTVGVFEGGGYTSKGVYRPCVDCTMKTNKPDNFCPVCRAALKRMIDYYIDR